MLLITFPNFPCQQSPGGNFAGMLFTPFIRAGLLLAVFPGRGQLVIAASTPLSADPCAKIEGIPFVDPADAIACQKSFAFDEKLRQNVLSVVSRVFDFFTFEEFYVNSPPPFEDSTKDIRAELARINATQYAVSTLSNNDTQSMNSTTIFFKTDYDFNQDLWDFTTQLNDGHTRMLLVWSHLWALLVTPLLIRLVSAMLQYLPEHSARSRCHSGQWYFHRPRRC